MTQKVFHPRLMWARRGCVATRFGLMALLATAPWGLGAAHAADAGTAPPAAKEARELRNPLMRGFGELLRSNADDLKDSKDNVERMLREADAALSEIKNQNRDALRGIRTAPFSGHNVVLIVASDLGFGDLSCYGQEHFRTPNIDALAEHGLRFASFYSGGTSTAASSWTLMTGADTAAARVGNQVSFELARGRPTLGTMMWRAGYDTVFVGPWSLGGDPEGEFVSEFHGFDQWLGHVVSGGDGNVHFPEAVWGNGRRIPLQANAGGKSGKLGQEYYVEHAVAYLGKWGEHDRQHHPKHHVKASTQDPQRPFFLVCFLPLTAAAQQALPALGSLRDGKLPEADQVYAAAVSRLDSDVGKIVQEIDRQGLTLTTAVFFTAANGPSCDPATADRLQSTRGLRGRKGDLYEGGMRVPLIARWPGHAPEGEVCYYHAAMWDVVSTCAEIAGRPLSGRGCDGLSLVPIMRRNQESKPRMLYWEAHEGGLAQAVRKGPWKVVRPAGKMRLEDVELYNLQDDPRETQNVAKQHPEIVKQFLKP